jgi:2-polyprenyl-3-methyl-5-hydroxy-6-metoxy-1,4-benzoquinol methylase
MKSIEMLHGSYVQERRVRVLSNALARQIPRNARVLDVGAGDGQMAFAIQKKRPDLELHGLDVHMRERSQVPIRHFDGKHLPDIGGSYDVLMFVDVLHHTENPFVLLREAAPDKVAGPAVASVRAS